MTMNTHAPISEEQKEKDGMIAIQTIEETVADIMRRNGYNAARAAQQMTHFAKGYAQCALSTQSTTAVQKKMQAMIDDLLETTCLTPKEIDDLIVMVNFA
jgi:phage-related tail protein